jgi:thioredoxin 1
MLNELKSHVSGKKYFILLVVILLSINLTAQNSNEKPKVTFVELGSVNCIPCKQMQPVMKAIEEKYGDQVKVIFYDVWKEDQKKYSKQYVIKLIPTQIFLDANGKEFHRHEGFYPEAEIDKILQGKGLKVKTKK